jgi:hypothetical protein
MQLASTKKKKYLKYQIINISNKKKNFKHQEEHQTMDKNLEKKKSLPLRIDV